MEELNLVWHGRNATVMITSSEKDAGKEENIQQAVKIAEIRQDLLPNIILGLEPPHYFLAMRRVFYVTRGRGVVVAGRNVISLWPGLLVFLTSEQVETIIPDHILEIREAFTVDEEHPNLAGRMAISPFARYPAELRQHIGYFPKKIRRKMAKTYVKRTLSPAGGKCPKINLSLPELYQRLAIDS